MSDTNLDAMLDMTLDDLADVPSYEPFPNGAYRVTCKLTQKEVGNHPCFEAMFAVVEVHELSNPEEDSAPAPGSEASVLYMMDNEFGQSNFKKFASPLAKVLGTRTLKELQEKLAEGYEFDIVTGLRKAKTGDKVYMEVKKVITE
jgi:hypothetical protein